MELEIAAARTNSISSVPAFLTEHLRRRFVQKPKNNLIQDQIDKKEIGKSFQTAKRIESFEPKSQNFEAEPLTREGRENVLKTMQNYIQKGERQFILNLQDSYTVEDWEWLTENLFPQQQEQPAELKIKKF